MKSGGTQMSRIRLASTILLVRQIAPEAHDYEIYTIKRPDTMMFLPGYTAFPGGALEGQDFSPEWEDYIDGELRSYNLLPKQQFTAEELESSTDSTLTTSEIASPYVHRIAALRELFEETGLLLGRQKQTRKAHVLSVVNNKKLEEYRNALLDQKISFLDLIKELNLTLDTQSLVWIGKRLTPPSKPIRYDTHFFLTYVASDTIPSPLPGEVAGDDWLKPAEALERIEKKLMLCVQPTEECFSILARELQKHDFINKLHS
jgi:8-oxo-dGTP pyrophosphatase MutT (NUDIX family)